MSDKKHICLISQSHLCRNPRVLKEAIAFSRAGHYVTIVNSTFSQVFSDEDDKLIQGYNIAIRPISALNKKDIASYTDRILFKLGTFLNAFFRVENYFALGYGLHRYAKPCALLRADLYIGHQEAGLYVGNLLLKKGFKVAFDFEDWYAEDLLPAEQKKRPLQLIRKLEKTALHFGYKSYTTSNVLAEQLSIHYKCPKPATIYNVFEKPNVINKKAISSNCIKLFWFSQTIGPGRGLEGIIGILSAVSVNIELHLLGAVSKSFQEKLIATSKNQFKIVFHSVVSPDALHEKICTFDIGLALEQYHPPSRNLTITNKFFQYLQAGLPIISSSTLGQLEIFNKYKPGFLIEDVAESEVSAALERWLRDDATMNEAKRRAIVAANDLHYEIEVQKLINYLKLDVS
ncbi:glycosyltransferase family protein [Pedobacter sandarakinus]|uniref:hypothetical protein n=1 Tax=Pedobacter sandarakinus TaxID=353156 RepID=UPI002245D712|nr:hypothetical protein [Pedobacter sandarakinus]MCX2575912.1 hypothetical protein [Pedobacter sandarakinus]